MTEQRTKAAAEPPLDCRVGRDVVAMLRERAARKWTDEANRSASLFGQAADEIERLRDELQLASDTARYACDGWNDALMHEGAHMAAKAIEARKVPNAKVSEGENGK